MADETSICTVEHGTIFWRNALNQNHRVDGPAVEWDDGEQWWCLNGEFHRADGPALEFTNGHKYWYIDGMPFKDELTFWLAATEWKKANTP